MHDDENTQGPIARFRRPCNDRRRSKARGNEKPCTACRVKAVRHVPDAVARDRGNPHYGGIED